VTAIELATVEETRPGHEISVLFLRGQWVPGARLRLPATGRPVLRGYAPTTICSTG
jgi:hypothetical protein